MNARVARGIYRIIQAVRGERVFSALEDLESTQWYSSGQIEELQFRLLVDIVRHAYKNVPYYREKFDEVGSSPYDLHSLEDLKSIPILTKEDIHERHEDLIARDRKYRYSKDSTSGSSGPATIVFTDRTASKYEHAAVFRSLRWYSMDYGMKTVRFWGSQLDRKRIFKDELIDHMLNRVTFSTNDLSEERMMENYKKIIRFKPKIIYGFTSAIHQFCLFLEQNNLDIKKNLIGLVIGTGEVFHDFQRKEIEKVLGCTAMNEYGCAEFGPIAYGCPNGGFHIMAEYLIVETLGSKACKSGHSTGEIIVTHLRNRVMPMIRYRLGDSGTTLHNACDCGRRLPMIKNIEGRTVDFIKTPDGIIVHGLSFDYLPKYFDRQIDQFQIVQDKVDSIKVNLVPGKEFSEKTLINFEDKLRQLMGSKVMIRFVFYDSYLPRELMGKYRMVMSIYRNSNRSS
jgi:phenylacetate-CoA ligase